MAVKRCITLSFKNTKKDLSLYDFLLKLEDRSTEVKQVLYKHFIEGKESEVIKKEIPAKSEINILDF